MNITDLIQRMEAVGMQKDDIIELFGKTVKKLDEIRKELNLPPVVYRPNTKYPYVLAIIEHKYGKGNESSMKKLTDEEIISLPDKEAITPEKTAEEKKDYSK